MKAKKVVSCRTYVRNSSVIRPIEQFNSTDIMSLFALSKLALTKLHKLGRVSVRDFSFLKSHSMF